MKSLAVLVILWASSFAPVFADADSRASLMDASITAGQLVARSQIQLIF